MFFSLDTLKKILAIDNSKAANPTKTTRGTSGSADSALDLDIFVQDPWVDVHVTPPPPLPPIIISTDAFFTELAAKYGSEDIIDFIASLTKYFKVYLWDDKLPLGKNSPLRGDLAFWEKEKSISFQHAGKVSAALIEQGLSPNTFVIIDDDKAKSIIKHINYANSHHPILESVTIESFISTSILDTHILTIEEPHLPFTWISDNVDPNKIECLTFKNEKLSLSVAQIQSLQRKLPKLKQITFEYLSAETLQSYLATLTTIILEIQNLEITSNQLTLPQSAVAGVRIYNLICKATSDIFSIDLSKTNISIIELLFYNSYKLTLAGTAVKSLVINAKQLQDPLLIPASLKQLYIKNYSDTLTLPADNQLQQLLIYYCTLSQPSLDLSASNLKTVKIFQLNMQTAKAKHGQLILPSTVENLEIANSPVAIVNAATLTQLKRVRLHHTFWPQQLPVISLTEFEASEVIPPSAQSYDQEEEFTPAFLQTLSTASQLTTFITTKCLPEGKISLPSSIQTLDITAIAAAPSFNGLFKLKKLALTIASGCKDPIQTLTTICLSLPPSLNAFEFTLPRQTDSDATILIDLRHLPYLSDLRFVTDCSVTVLLHDNAAVDLNIKGGTNVQICGKEVRSLFIPDNYLTDALILKTPKIKKIQLNSCHTSFSISNIKACKALTELTLSYKKTTKVEPHNLPKTLTYLHIENGFLEDEEDRIDLTKLPLETLVYKPLSTFTGEQSSHVIIKTLALPNSLVYLQTSNVAVIDKLTFPKSPDKLRFCHFINCSAIKQITAPTVFNNLLLLKFSLNDKAYDDVLYTANFTVLREYAKDPVAALVHINNSIDIYRQKPTQSLKKAAPPAFSASGLASSVAKTHPAPPQTTQLPEVSVFSLQNSSQTFDMQTNPPSSTTREGEVKCALYNINGQAIPLQHFRMEVLNTVTYDEKTETISFTYIPKLPRNPIDTIAPATDYQTAIQNLRESFNDPSTHMGIFEGTVHPGVVIPLPTNCIVFPDDLNRQIATNCQLKIEYAPDSHQFMVTPSITEETFIKIGYIFRLNKTYLESRTPGSTVLVDDPAKTALPPSLYAAIDSKISADKWHDLKAKGTPPDQKFAILTKYFKNTFTSKPLFLQEEKKPSPFEILVQVLEQRAGVCRHAANWFYLLQQAFIPGSRINIIRNSVHRLIEVWVKNKDGKLSCHRFDLGGAPASIHALDTQFTCNPFTLPSEAATQEQEKQKHTLTANRYAALFDPKVLIFNTASELLQQAQAQKKALFITLSASDLQSVENVYGAIFKHLHPDGNIEGDRRCLLINSAADFTKFITYYTIQDHLPVKIKGPLHAMLQSKQAIFLCINWSELTPQQRVTYKSIMDQQPFVHDTPLPKNLHVIGFAKEKITDKSFDTRTISCKISDSFCQKDVANDTQTTTNVGIAEIDLQGRYDWKKALGSIQFSGAAVHFLEGTILTVNDSVHTLRILNPPSDPEFNQFKERLNSENHIFVNGKMVAKKFNIVTIDSPDKTITLPSNVTLVDSPLLQSFSSDIPHLTTSNWHKLFGYNTYKDTLAYSNAGLLAQHAAFYVHGIIPKSECIKLIEAIQKQYPTKRFTFYVVPEAGFESYHVNTPERLEPKTITSLELPIGNDQTLYFSEDPTYCARQLLTRLPGRDNKVIPVNPTITFEQLLYAIQLQVESDKIVFPTIQHDIFTLLQNNTRIILQGEISTELYLQLITLLACKPPYLEINGQRCQFKDVPNPLVIVAPVTAKQNYTYIDSQAIIVQYSIEDYLAAFPQHTTLVKQLFQFAKFVALLPRHSTSEHPPFILNYPRIQNILSAFQIEDFHPANPLKSVLSYEYSYKGPEYFYLNVIAKLFFNARSANKYLPKRQAFIQTHHFETLAEFKPFVWEYLNYFSGQELLALLGEDPEKWLDPNFDFPQPQLIENIWRHWSEQKSQSATEHPHQATAEKLQLKQEIHFKKLLGDPETPLIFLKGLPGTGKTSIVERFKKDFKEQGYSTSFYTKGMEEIETWLEKGGIILFDEANLKPNGAWDFLKSISLKLVKHAYYNGKLYTLTNNHKIIVAGNPEGSLHLGDTRFFHTFFQESAKIIIFKLPPDEYLKENIILPFLKPLPLALDIKNWLADKLLASCKLSEKHNSYLSLSIRDIESLLERFTLLFHNVSTEININQVLYHTIQTEFAGTFSELATRKNFLKAVAALLEMEDNLLPVTANQAQRIGDIFLPPSKQYILETIEQSLALRQQALAQPKESHHKKAMFIQGESGVGKTSLLLAFLESKGFKRDAIDPTKCYVQVSAGSKLANQAIKEAVDAGKIVVLDEVNADENASTFIAKLLDQAPPGAMIFASLNPPTANYAGRSSLADFLRNRAMLVHFDAYTEADYQLILTHPDIHQLIDLPDSQAIVKKFLASEDPQPRRFFDTLRIIMQQAMDIQPGFQSRS